MCKVKARPEKGRLRLQSRLEKADDTILEPFTSDLELEIDILGSQERRGEHVGEWGYIMMNQHVSHTLIQESPWRVSSLFETHFLGSVGVQFPEQLESL